jgi:cytochrome c
MKRSGITWNASTLDKWLTNPDAFIHGTSMMFPGLRSSRDREDVIAYLHAVSEGKAPTISSGGMMGGGMMGGRKADLKHAPPEGQVTKLSHCGDTYTVSTADGKVEKVWEFNLLLKIDASHQGPPEANRSSSVRACGVTAHPSYSRSRRRSVRS